MGRAPCCDKSNVKRGPWSPEEDATLKNYLQKYGTGGNWISLPQKAGLRRCGKSCRLRWLNYLRPNIKHGAFSEDEDNTIISMYYQMGSRWSVIAANLPGRTDNDVKNYWNTKLKKKVFGGTNNNNKFTPSISPKVTHHATFTNNNSLTFQIPGLSSTLTPSLSYDNTIITNQALNNQIYVPTNPTFSDLLSHCTTSSSMSLLPGFATVSNLDNAYAHDPFSISNSTHNNPFVHQASSCITNGENVNVLPYEEVSSASGSSSVVYGSNFEDDPFYVELGRLGLMQEEVMMNNPACNFDVDQEDIKPQGLGQGVAN